jgi:riboflavin kinase/FMN adenylyltransferase
MERLTNEFPLPRHLRGGVLALGNFDGFHRGHQCVVAKARARAGAEGRPLVVATFDPHPVRLFDPEVPPFLLTTLDQRERMFRRAGADAMLVFNFDRDLATSSAEAFVEDRIAARTGAAAIFTGQDFTYGKGRTGTVARLAASATGLGMTAEAVDPVLDEDGTISSSRIRAALRDGDCATATSLLSRPFAVEGIVQHGHKLGRTIGFPTANLLMDEYVRPKYGVYAVRGRLPGGRVLDGVATLGIRPIMDVPEELLEPHFLDFTGDLYDQVIEVEFIEWMRGEVKLSGFAELKEWIARDVTQARAILAGTPHLA